MPRGQMKRKSGEEEEDNGGSRSRKKARVEEDALGKFLSLVEADNTLAGAANYWKFKHGCMCTVCFASTAEALGYVVLLY